MNLLNDIIKLIHFQVKKMRQAKPGDWRVQINRAKNDLGFIQFILVTFIAIKQGLEWWWFLFIPVYLIYKYFDITKYHAQEMDYNFKKSRYLMTLYKRVERIYENLFGLSKSDDLPKDL